MKMNLITIIYYSPPLIIIWLTLQDSKKRLGKFCWQWAIVLYVLSSTYIVFVDENSFEYLILDIFVSVGSILFLFAMYRIFTRFSLKVNKIWQRVQSINSLIILAGIGIGLILESQIIPKLADSSYPYSYYRISHINEILGNLLPGSLMIIGMFYFFIGQVGTEITNLIVQSPQPIKSLLSIRSRRPWYWAIGLISLLSLLLPQIIQVSDVLLINIGITLLLTIFLTYTYPIAWEPATVILSLFYALNYMSYFLRSENMSYFLRSSPFFDASEIAADIMVLLVFYTANALIICLIAHIRHRQSRRKGRGLNLEITNNSA